ncbi:MAG: phosphodiester glycosidase family protein [Thermovirgaceae bacterium]|nr:phosphodiester glycosidase family protein [Synergistales bacterium]MDI9393213.1 phosphodiester glycosidase family protein [Synergistota bacterium]NLV66007.1 hypothetical protein [Synergistaceae bacterium]HRW88141.1 phosphodiester glycosidase family protein [Thermovirgaceae bacterium]MDD3831001.1 phosphodiester glycosidase family protein [Synergistales bacterium]
MKGRPLTVQTTVALLSAFLVAVGAWPSVAATRGELINVIVSSLGLPEWPGETHFADTGPDHPFRHSVETAAALGILNPSEHFYPDIEASKAEAVMFSLQAMGLRHEASIVNSLTPGRWPDLPVYIAPYMTLATQIQPSPPEQFLQQPWGQISAQDLSSLRSWLGECASGLSWEKEFVGENSVLVLHREHAGRPPSEWGIQSVEFGTPEEASRAAAILRGMGLEAVVQALEWSWVAKVGPFQHYVKAWETMMKIPSPEMTVVPFSTDPGGALFFAALGFDPSVSPPRIVTAASISGKRLPLDLIAVNSGAEGAINGGFFSGTRIVGSLVIDSRPLSGPHGARSAMGWDRDGSRVHFGRGDFRTFISIGEKELDVSTMNSTPPLNGIGIFTPDVWSYVTAAPVDGWEVTVKEGVVSGVRHSSTSNHFVTREGFLVIARGVAGEQLRNTPPGAPVSLRTQWVDQGFRGLDHVLQAGPMLIKKGTRVFDPEGFSPRTLSVPHPRSFVGSDGEKVWFVVIDGRDPWHSNGATIVETAAVAERLGLVDALNLDGGGSSSIWWMGKIVTSPPGGIVRPVPYALVF